MALPYIPYFRSLAQLCTREFRSREVAQTQIYVLTHSLLAVSFYAHIFRPLAASCGRYGFDIGCLRVKLMFSRGNYDTHSNEHKSDVAERVLITKASVCVRNEPLHSAVEWR